MSRRPTGYGLGSVYKRTITRKRSNGTAYDTDYWVATISLPGGKRKDLYAKTKAEASKKLRTALQAREDGTLATGPKQTVGQFIERWLEDSVKPTTRPRTYLSYAERARLHLIPSLGKIALSDLSPQHVQALYAAKLKAGLSSSTVNGIHVVLHRALKQAVRWKLASRNAADEVDVPRPRKHHGQPFDADELATFIKAIQGDRHEYLWLTFLATGLRFGEAAALRWGDVDLEGRVLHVRHTITRQGNKGYAFSEPKTHSSRRTIPLPASAVEALKAQRILMLELRMLAGQRWTDLDLVFPSSVGTPIRETHLIVLFHAILDQAGLARRRIHDLRGSYATRLFALNAHPRAIQSLLGHANIQTTFSAYVGNVPAVLREAADSLDGVFGKAV